jgi:hypothetical protein
MFQSDFWGVKMRNKNITCNYSGFVSKNECYKLIYDNLIKYFIFISACRYKFDLQELVSITNLKMKMIMAKTSKITYKQSIIAHW